ncbi:uncharacterized protein MYCGRDRAFT_89242 [Zymoseptoria tritici IPO323]|uniref:SET domain-containing protein n=1 Tax=Zymoseptoria tritici (strain CBS 115943 / IPO323) TaxID=336722 RepID=F9X0X9_ZYMTI|nr:uncharacterized protein MYCGRDRAFT_89242 [Zymoseptoria tritici IPO323]EGP91172.1 hypothetical protein MYCGRDRAFT_89242 [Zymoseptoria tritici IPO323]
MASPFDVDVLARDIGQRIASQLPSILRQLLAEHNDFSTSGDLQLECNLLNGQLGSAIRPQTLKLASINIAEVVNCATPSANGDHSGTPVDDTLPSTTSDRPPSAQAGASAESPGTPLESSGANSPARSLRPRSTSTPHADEDTRPAKRRATGGLRIGGADQPREQYGAVTRRLESDSRVFPQRKKRLPDNPHLQPSTLDKFINGIWENIYSGSKLDPAEVIEQWQAIESSGQPRLLMDAESQLATHNDALIQGSFGRMNVLTRKISQTSRTCRSLEVIVQAHWTQVFDERVRELSAGTTKEKAKKTAISEACIDFGWTEKELRNKMAIWRGYNDIMQAAGWAALCFAGMGLYRFCKYRVSFTEETFQTLRSLRHRFEVAADTLHPRWRSLLAIVDAPIQRKYTGHPHDWVVCGPADQAIPLPVTYHKWDLNFHYTHLDESCIDEDAWGLFDPRTVSPRGELTSMKCPTCSSSQSDDPRQNSCTCFPNLYGHNKAGFIPVQVYQTPNGKNNGLLACCAFERGAAVGEFVGQVTSGLANMDVMVGQTDRASYQIWQGKMGNHTRFVNHSCNPNSQFERFVWMGTQREFSTSV